MLVAAVLRPEQREDGQLEVVRVAVEQLADALQLSVREAERAVERLFDDLRQMAESSRACGWSKRPRTWPLPVARFSLREPSTPPHAARPQRHLGRVVPADRDRPARPRAGDAHARTGRGGGGCAGDLPAPRAAGPPVVRGAATPQGDAARAGPAQLRAAVLPDRLGPAVRRLRARGDPELVRAALHGAARVGLRARGARDRAPARRAARRLRRRRRARRRRALGRRTGRGRLAGRGRRSALLRVRRAVRGAATRGRVAARALPRRDAGGDDRPRRPRAGAGARGGRLGGGARRARARRRRARRSATSSTSRSSSTQAPRARSSSPTSCQRSRSSTA